MNPHRLIFVLSIAAGLAACGHGGKSAGASRQVAAPALATGQPRILYYRNAMNAAVTSSVPAKDNMGMDYIPVYADAAGAGVKVSPTVQDNLGVRTGIVDEGPLPRQIDTVGYVGFNKALVTRLHTRAEGWVQDLVIRSVGERVHQGELLFTLYAPKLVTAEEEYLRVLAGGDAELIAASRQRLTALGISAQQVQALTDTHKSNAYIPYYAGQGGVVQELEVRPGQYVTPDTELMQLGGFASVWISAEVMEQQSDWVQLGDTAELKIAALPGKVFKGKVDFIGPSLDPVSRTQEVRLRFDNPGEILKPGMFADARIEASPIADAISVPAAAVIQTADGDRVIVARPGGLFEARAVTLGIESGERVQILSGLKLGEHVVVSGQFLLDSEESLRGGLGRLSSGGAP